MIQGLKLKPETKKLLEENVGETLDDTGVGVPGQEPQNTDNRNTN